MSDAAVPAREPKAAVSLESISKVFGSGATAFTAVDDVSLAIHPNEFFTLLGPSGCGKTTLLRLIAGFEHATRGTVRLDGEDVSALPPFRRPVNTVFQSYALFPHMTVAENIGFGLEMLGQSRPDIDRRVAEMLALVRMEDLAKRGIGQISGGQAQRVALARALAPKPKVLLLDEPLSALDLKLRTAMQIELKRLQRETGITFIFVTHDQHEALTMSDRIAVMSKGTIRQIGSPRAIYDEPTERFVADFIGDTNFLEGDIVETTGQEATVAIGAARIGARRPAEAPSAGRTLIVVRPEHASLTAPREAALTGTLANIVYFGTDTNFHVVLPGGETFVVREQNAHARASSVTVGETVGIALDPGAARILKR